MGKVRVLDRGSKVTGLSPHSEIQKNSPGGYDKVHVRQYLLSQLTGHFFDFGRYCNLFSAEFK